MSLLKNNDVEVQKTEKRPEVTPASRIKEGGEAFTLTVELPGVDEKGIEIMLENRTLSITADSQLGDFPDYKKIAGELPEVRYRTAYELPECVDSAAIKAATRNGLLILTIPKHEEVKPRRIEVVAH